MRKEEKNSGIEQLNKVLRKGGEIVIYGAGVIAYGAYVALKEVYGIENLKFVVTDADERKMIGSAVVKGIDEISDSEKKALFLVATPEVYHTEIKKKLQEKEIEKVLFLNNTLEFLLMSQYYEKMTDFEVLNSNMVEGYAPTKQSLDENDVMVCMCQSMYDKKLQTAVVREKYVQPIHVGRALSDVSLAPLTDNTGENISDKNRIYSELTATYWLWKNVKSKYKGIFHYRRQLMVSERELQWCMDNDVDAILPLPFVCYPNTEGQYGRYILKEDREILMRAIQEIVPNEMKTITKILDDKYLYNYNMLIAKSEVYDEYCEWIFPILSRAEQLRNEIKPGENDRFAGYFGEVLTSLFFLKNKEQFKIVHAEKQWCV